MTSILIILSIFISIALGYKTKINTGLFAIMFAYLIGCFQLEMSASEVISTWPISTMFVILSVSLFYNFAMVNGTLEKTARNLLYACRNYPQLLPFALYLASATIAALGAGFFTVMAFMAPVTLLICKESKSDPIIGAIAVNCGALSGANFMTSGSGIIYRGLMDTAGYTSESFQTSTIIFIASVIFSLLFISISRLLPSAYKNAATKVIFEKPEKYNQQQKTNLLLILSMMSLVLVFPILNILLPDAPAISFINTRLDVGCIAIIFSILALLLNLAPQKDVIAKVPWNTILMICGVGMLIKIAILAGTLDMLSSWVTSSIPIWLIPIAFSVIAAIMGFFSSTLGVVCPALFPLVSIISESTGIPATALFTCIVIGAQSSAISPFSSGGSLLLGSCDSDEQRNYLFNRLLFVAIPVSITCSTLYNAILSLILV